MIKSVVKKIVGAIRAKCFQVKVGNNVYIGKGCALKGKHNIVLEDNVIVRPHAQIWGGG